MDSLQIIVTFTGIVLSVFVLWFFLFSQRRVTRALNKADIQEITIAVKGGYDPDRIVVRKGTPVRLNFFRQESAGCSDRVVFPDFGINRDLPAFKTTAITLTPEKPGEYTFTCGMKMLRGTLIVEDS